MQTIIKRETGKIVWGEHLRKERVKRKRFGCSAQWRCSLTSRLGSGLDGNQWELAMNSCQRCFYMSRTRDH